MAFAPVFARPFSPAFDRHAAAAAAAADWWEVAGKTCVAAYQPKGAASLSASYTNLANPGTYDAAPGDAPTFNAATGWEFNGSSDYLTTGIVPASGYTMVIRFTDWAPFGWLIGAYNGSGNNQLSIGNPNGADLVEYGSGKTSEVIYGAAVTSGVLGVAGQQGYRDGSATGGTISAWDGSITAGIEIGELGGLGGGNTASKVQAVAIYSDTLDATEMAALYTAMMAL